MPLRPPRRSSERKLVALRRGGVDDGFGQFGELGFSGRFFRKGFLQNVGHIVVTKLAREADRSAVARHFVMLDPPRGSDEPGIAHGFLGLFADHFTAFDDEPFHRRTLMAGEFLLDHFGDLIEAFHMPFRLSEMLGKTGAQFGMGGGFRHFRESLHKLRFRAVEVFEFLVE